MEYHHQVGDTVWGLIPFLKTFAFWPEETMTKRRSPDVAAGDLFEHHAQKEGQSPRTLSPIKRRLLEASLEIRQDEPEDFAFCHSVLCQCAMPAASTTLAGSDAFWPFPKA
jgi:hypothetical protein